MGGIKMNRRWLLILFSVLGILMFYEIFNNDFSILMLLIGISSFYLRTRVEEDKKSTMLFISLIAIALALISSEILWLLLIVLFVLILNAFPEVYRTLRKVISDKKESSKETELSLRLKLGVLLRYCPVTCSMEVKPVLLKFIRFTSFQNMYYTLFCSFISSV